MITYKSKGGRLGEIMWLTYGLFYISAINNIPTNHIFLNKKRIGYDYYMNKSYPILENIEIFDNIENHLVEFSDEEYELTMKQFKTFNYRFLINAGISLQTLRRCYDNIILDDYWNVPFNKKLFDSLFKSKKLIDKVKNLHLDIDFDNSCSLHIRRGDFAKIQSDLLSKHRYLASKIPPTLTSILNEIDKIRNVNRNIKIICFSDDILWCKQNLNNVDNIVFIDPNMAPCYDIVLISLCRYHIYLNSSIFNQVGILLSDSYAEYLDLLVPPLKVSNLQLLS